MKIIGHRGARGLGSENTLESLNKAISCNVDEIEFDVRVTKDNIPVVHHDSKIHGLNNKEFIISKQTLKSLKKQKPDMPTLKEVFDHIDKKVSLYIEIKPGVKVQPIIESLKEQIQKGRPAQKLRVASFNQNILLKVHETIPEIPKIVNESWNSSKARRRAAALHTKQISMSQRWMWSGFVRYMNRHGYDLYAYTINKPKKAYKFQKNGLAGVVTDFPDRIKSKR